MDLPNPRFPGPPLPRPIPKSRHEVDMAGITTKASKDSEPMRTKLPTTRKSVTHKFDLSGHDCYITVGLYEDGSPGELFIKMSKMGSTVSGFADTMGILFSLALQHGVPLKAITGKLRHTLFEPNESGKATSVPDYICKWMDEQFEKKNHGN